MPFLSCKLSNTITIAAMFKCPNCNSSTSQVLESRHLRRQSTKRRRYECQSCALRFTTYESIQAKELLPEPFKIMEIQPPTEDISRLDRIEAELAEMKSMMDIQLRLRSAESVPIEDLDFSMRVYNALKRKRIHTLATLLTYTTTDLLSIRNFGINSLSEVQSVLCLRGLALRQKRASS